MNCLVVDVGTGPGWIRINCRFDHELRGSDRRQITEIVNRLTDISGIRIEFGRGSASVLVPAQGE